MTIASYKTILVLSTAAFALCFGLATADSSSNENVDSHQSVGVDQPADHTLTNMSLVDIFTANPSFSTMIKGLVSTDLITVLSGTGPFTVFAPNDEAFQKLPPQTIKNLFKAENKDKLAALLTYHIVPGKLSIADLKTMDIKTVNGKTLNIQVVGDQIMINNAKVIQKNMVGSNGIVYTIDKVLLP